MKEKKGNLKKFEMTLLYLGDVTQSQIDEGSG